MLTRVCLTNFVHFRVKDEDQDKEIKVHEFEFHEGGTFFFIGGNRSGKSCVFEAIRRCMSTSKNFFFSTCDDKNEPLVVICEYSDKQNETTTYSCYVSIRPKPQSEESTHSAESTTVEEKCVLERIVAKIFFIKDHSKTNSEIIQELSVDLLKENSDGFPVNYCFELGENTPPAKRPEDYLFGEITIVLLVSFVEKYILGTNKLAEFVKENIEDYNEETPCEISLKQYIDNHIVITDPMRSISPVQWTRSKKLDIGSSRTIKNVNFALEMGERSEILAWYLNQKTSESEIIAQSQAKDISKSMEKMNEEVDKIFNILTNKSRVKFEKINDEILVIDNGNKISLEKAPEGIFEAMVCSILLSIKDVTTVCLEEPGRGMHMQMVERLRDLILKKVEDKTVIIITHIPTFLSSWNIGKTFIFRGSQSKLNKSEFYATKVNAILKGEGKTKRFISNSIMATIFFARRLLFVEGESDLLFMAELKSILLENNSIVQENFSVPRERIDEFSQFVSSLHILSLQGKQNKDRLEEICRALNIERYFLLDYDAILEREDTKETCTKFLEAFKKNDTELTEDEIMTDVSVLEKIGVFVWKRELSKHLEEGLQKKLESIKGGSIEYVLFTLCETNEELKSTFSANNSELKLYTRKRKHDGEGKAVISKLFKEKELTDQNIRTVVQKVIDIYKNDETSEVFRFISFLVSAFKKEVDQQTPSTSK